MKNASNINKKKTKVSGTLRRSKAKDYQQSLMIVLIQKWSRLYFQGSKTILQNRLATLNKQYQGANNSQKPQYETQQTL